MLDPRSKDPIARQVRHPQIIVGGLVAGPLIFLVIVLVLVQQGGPAVAGIAPILTYVAVAHVVMAVLARVIVPNLIVARARRRIIQGTFAQLFARLFEQTGDAGKLFFVAGCPFNASDHYMLWLPIHASQNSGYFISTRALGTLLSPQIVPCVLQTTAYLSGAMSIPWAAAS
jgi:hypothetical protein